MVWFQTRKDAHATTTGWYPFYMSRPALRESCVAPTRMVYACRGGKRFWFWSVMHAEITCGPSRKRTGLAEVKRLVLPLGFFFLSQTHLGRMRTVSRPMCLFHVLVPPRCGQDKSTQKKKKTGGWVARRWDLAWPRRGEKKTRSSEFPLGRKKIPASGPDLDFGQKSKIGSTFPSRQRCVSYASKATKLEQQTPYFAIP